MVDLQRLAQGRIRARLQRLRNAEIITDNCQGERPFGGLAFAGCRQQQPRFRLLIPIDNYDLITLLGDFLDRLYRLGAVLSLHTETGQYLANRLGSFLI